MTVEELDRTLASVDPVEIHERSLGKGDLPEWLPAVRKLYADKLGFLFFYALNRFLKLQIIFHDKDERMKV